MALTSSLYSGVSGLVNMGNAMQVIGDNISNVNTTGFKAARTTFQDIMAQSINTARGSSQVGRGSATSDVAPLFTQGSFESTSSPTDLAIAGNGFFMVSNPKIENSVYYTRAGQFHVDKNGYLVNPAGLRVQGWDMEEQPDGTFEIIGSIKDIEIQNTSPPVATSLSTVAVNLDDRAKPVDSSNLLIDKWDGSSGDPNGGLKANVDYEYKTTFKVYDSVGNTHELTVYFDKEQDDPNVQGDERTWEFLVAMNPEEDKSAKATSGGNLTTDAGKLLWGKIQFSPDGQIERIFDISRYNNDQLEQNLETDTSINQAFGDHNYPQIIAFFQEPTGQTDPKTGLDLTAQRIEFNFGAKAEIDTANNQVIGWDPETITTTQYANRSSTLFYDQNGFAAGFLESLSVDSEGIISGSYSNGRVIGLAQLALARFYSPSDLAKEGGNLWRETTKSGTAITGQPRTNGLGSIAANALEQSTVDMGTEFVKLITTQRAFQANSRVITTTDDMLNELLNMKR